MRGQRKFIVIMTAMFFITAMCFFEVVNAIAMSSFTTLVGGYLGINYITKKKKS